MRVIHGGDDIGFLFDPYDEYPLEDERDHYSNPAHFEELTFLASHLWVDTHGETVDMSKTSPKDIRYLVNIVQWCDKWHRDYMPYKDTKQYKYARKRISKLQRRVVAAFRILNKPNWWLGR